MRLSKVGVAARLWTLLLMLGFLVGLTCTGCGSSGDSDVSTTAKVEYTFNLMSERAVGSTVAYYSFYCIDADGDITRSQIYVGKAASYTLDEVPLDTDHIVVELLDSTKALFGMGITEVSGKLSKGATLAVKDQDYFTSTELYNRLRCFSTTPAASSIKVGDSVCLQAIATFDMAVEGVGRATPVSVNVSDHCTWGIDSQSYVNDITDPYVAYRLYSGVANGRTVVTTKFSLGSTVIEQQAVIKVGDATVSSVVIEDAAGETSDAVILLPDSSFDMPSGPDQAPVYTDQLSAYAMFSDGDFVDVTNDVAWRIEEVDASIQIDPYTAVVTGVKASTSKSMVKATYIVTDGITLENDAEKTGSLNVQVVDAEATIAIDPAAVSVEVGQSQRLEVFGSYNYIVDGTEYVQGGYLITDACVFSSDDPATVSVGGTPTDYNVITGEQVSADPTTVTASFWGITELKGTCLVTVTPAVD